MLEIRTTTIPGLSTPNSLIQHSIAIITIPVLAKMSDQDDTEELTKSDPKTDSKALNKSEESPLAKKSETKKKRGKEKDTVRHV